MKRDDALNGGRKAEMGWDGFTSCCGERTGKTWRRCVCRQLRAEARGLGSPGDMSLGGRVGHLREVGDLGQETSGQVGGRPGKL